MTYIDIAGAYPAQEETIGLKSIPTTLSHSVGLPVLDNDVIIELRTAVCEREVVGSVWNVFSPVQPHIVLIGLLTNELYTRSILSHYCRL